MLKAKKVKNLKTLLRICEKLAEQKSDGHLSILRFTSHRKAMLAKKRASDSRRVRGGILNI